MCNTNSATPNNNAPTTELLQVHYVGLTEEAHKARSLRSGGLVACFAIDEDNREVYARFDDLVSYADMRHVALWPAAPRAELLDALAGPITAAPWRSRAARTLALAKRFAVSVEDDSPTRRWVGVVNLRTVDRKLIKHVLGAAPEHDPEASRQRWERRLGTSLDRAAIRNQLSAQNCQAFEGLRHYAEQRLNDRLFDPYAGMARPRMLASIALLSPLRERYLRAVGNAIRSASERPHARHVHLGAEGKTGKLLDDSGLFIATQGEKTRTLHLKTAFDAVVLGEHGAGLKTCRKRWRRVTRDIRRGDFPFTVHSPMAWGIGRACQ